jgi:hypothetical protein
MSRSFLWRCVFAGLTALVVAGPVQAKKPFVVNVEVNGAPVAPAGFSSVDDTVDYLDPTLNPVFANAAQDGIAAGLDFRGLAAGAGLSSGLPGSVGLSFSSNSAVLTFDVPLLGFSTTFDGGSCFDAPSCAQARRDALGQLRDFLKNDPAFLKSLLTAMTRYSPIDPIAGNPDSLFSRTMRRDFNYGFTNKVSQIWGCSTSAFNFTNDAPIQVAIAGNASDIFRDAQLRAAELQAQNEIGLGILASSTTAASTGGDYQTMAFELPFSYTAKFDSDPRKKFHVDLPLSYSDTDGAASYSLGLGFAYTHPLSDVWSLTPAVGVGATGSEDLGSAGGVSSYSLTSAYTWRLGGFALSMGNGVGRYSSLALKIGDVEAEADVTNTVFTNGFLLTGPSGLIAKNFVMEYSFVDTRMTGDQVYTDNYDEIGIALGHISTEMGVIDSYTKFGLSYLVARGEIDDITSLRLVLSSRF